MEIYIFTSGQETVSGVFYLWQRPFLYAVKRLNLYHKLQLLESVTYDTDSKNKGCYHFTNK